ncbi:acyl carrier protein [Edaphobacter sp.]|uniref:acyl carrier protein n=1 Tax=Edaphobacter sp. TaxID=1934404 RepID=UPI002DBC90BB|nr:acyl carrier protein [Edaphobacter sp.]HEU5340240.1 acyl carrier protein [Edaphobacter sp.]
MSLQPVPSSLRDLLADILEISPEQVTADLSIDKVENWDSFRHLQAILALEGEYGVQFDPQRVPELTSVALIQQELEKKGAAL